MNVSAERTANELFIQVSQGNIEVLKSASLEADLAGQLGRLINPRHDLYEKLLLGTFTIEKEWYDWNIGFILPHLNIDHVIPILRSQKNALRRSEGIAWGLGESGCDDPDIVDFLFRVCEECQDYDAWWCAAEALDKLNAGDSVDIKKRTLTKPEWQDLEYCLANLAQRPAVIGVLRQATVANTTEVILPACRKALDATDKHVVRNAVWLLERLRVDDPEIINALLVLYEQEADASTTLAPRIIEALGQIAAPSTRTHLEHALLVAAYYRTRAYAAKGLGRIGDARSGEVLQKALDSERDERVLPAITDALYRLRHPEKRKVQDVNRRMRWPENGMIVDESNKWYGNPEIYDKFSWAEDPLSLSLDIASSYIPAGSKMVADIGTGTGRLALHLASSCKELIEIMAIDGNQAMHDFLVQTVRQSPNYSKVKPLLGDISSLPIDDRSLDAVLSSWAFPSKMWDSATCLRQVEEVRRVLKPNGVLVTVGWDEQYRDQLSELWYRFVPEPDFRRESIEEWRRRRRAKTRSPRNCYLTFVKRGIKVPLMWPSAEEAAEVLGYLFGYSAGEWVLQQRICEFSIHVGITVDTWTDLSRSIEQLEADLVQVSS